MTTDAPAMVIIWDVDDVLNDLMRSWLHEWWIPGSPSRMQKYDDLTENPPHRVLGVSLPEYLESLDTFRTARFATLSPRPEVLSWFAEYGCRAHHVALTAVPQPYAELSAAWVFRHFAPWIRTFAFVPARAEQSASFGWVTKGEYVKWLGQGDVLIDDRESNVLEAKSLGLTGFVAPQPWNAYRGSSLQLVLQELSAVL